MDQIGAALRSSKEAISALGHRAYLMVRLLVTGLKVLIGLKPTALHRQV